MRSLRESRLDNIWHVIPFILSLPASPAGTGVGQVRDVSNEIMEEG